MRIDHRLGPRRAVFVEALLGWPPAANVPARILDYSRSGILAETAAPVPLYSRVGLIVAAPARGSVRLHRLRGYVIRRSATRLGIMLDDDVEPDALAALASLDASAPGGSASTPVMNAAGVGSERKARPPGSVVRANR